MLFSFSEIFRKELSVINFRRDEIRAGKVAGARPKPLEVKRAVPPHEKVHGGRHFLRDRSSVQLATAPSDPNARSAPLAPGSDLTGLAFSGGGIRSASFCLGVLQGLDSLSDHDEPHVLDAIDYLSVVSGGSYIGTSLVAGMMQPDYTFPFDSKIGDQEPPEMQHLRDYSNFLVPNGAIDYITSAALIFRGLIVNVATVLPILLFVAALTLCCNPTIDSLSQPDVLGFNLNLHIPGQAFFAVTTDLILALVVFFFATAIFTSRTYVRGKLRAREALGKLLAYALILVLVSAVFELQAYVLKGMFPSGEAPMANTGTHAGDQADLSWISSVLPSLSLVLVPVATSLIAFAQRLANIASATIGEQTWRGALKKHAARLGLYVAALVVPFLLWVGYLYLTFWGFRTAKGVPYNQHTPGFLQSLAAWLLPASPDWMVAHIPASLAATPPIAVLYVELGIILGLFSWLIGPNANSLHRLYRDRLSRAFLIDRADPATKKTSADRWTFSSLKPFDTKAKKWFKAAAYSPYLLVNTAINLEASKDLNKRGRNADTFVFSPLFIGSSATGYVDTLEMERLQPDVGLGTAMATSGAAASANMGANTVPILTFSLSLLNIRLGYWLANPHKLASFSNLLKRIWSNLGPYYFACETFGLLSEKRLNVYLTDGGHIENLGVYELLRRRCKVIVAVDAEADQEMSFLSFVRLQVLARIDLGILIDLPWPPLQGDALGVTDKVLHGPKGWPGSNGPHAAVGRIHYGDGETGVLIYLKASMSGDESDYLIDYKRRNPTFPHETTIDQFFSEDQFEVYRALGFHVCRNLFTGADAYGTFSDARPEWKEQVREALALLNIPARMADRVAARCDPPLPGLTDTCVAAQETRVRELLAETT